MSHKSSPVFAASLIAAAIAIAAPASAQTAQRPANETLVVTTADTLVTRHPYAESSAQMYSIWCQVYGCLGRYDYAQRKFVGQLAERWEQRDDVTWRFHLRKDLVRHDGGPGPTVADVLHSYNQVMTDPQSQGRFYLSSVKEIRRVDDHTFDVVTKEPASSLLGQLFDKFTITSEEIFKTQGGVASYNTAPIGWGPYKLTNFAISDRIALERHDAYPAKVETSPRNVLFRRIPEPDQRVTALLNGEVQIARLIPPQLVGRLENVPSVEIRRAPSNEPMFIGFSVKTKPWDDPRVRRAAAMAINKDVIIQRILFGMADRLDGPVGAQQICYTTPIDQKTPYDVAGARKLLAEAGYAGGGPVVDFFTATGRYISDRQIAEAITQMLNQAGFKATLHTPEFAGLWANVRAGKAPMYYMGRGLALEPSEWLSQYFETGVTPRIGYDNPKLNELFERERKTFDIIERCKIIREISQLIETEAPGIFLWNHQYVSGVRKGVRYVPDASGEIWLPDVRL